MFEAQKREFEAALVRSELQPTPGSFWITKEYDGVLRAKARKCCALSPAMLDLQCDPSDPEQMGTIPAALGVSHMWFSGAIRGFDERNTLIADPEYRDGYEWGLAMRRKYVEGINDDITNRRLHDALRRDLHPAGCGTPRAG